MSEEYNIEFGRRAINDLRNIYYYIRFTLGASDSATKIVEGILNAANSLSFMPKRFAVLEGALWNGKEIRKFTVKHFVVCYSVDDDSKKVAILRVTHAKRDYSALLM